MNNINYAFTAQGTVRTPGVQYTNAGKEIRCIRQNDRYMVWHIPGGSFWSGRGEQTYYPTHFIVLKIKRAPTAETNGLCDEIKMFESQDGQWGSARKDAIAYFEQLG